MKVRPELYPAGCLGTNKTDGRYMTEFMYTNLNVLAKAIVNDMTFLGIISSSTLEVGTGKSVFAQQLGEAWSEMIEKNHGIKVPFGIKNIVFKPEDLIERSFELPKYSCIILDEWEDAHYWSELGKTLRSFFRKCRQLNLFMIIIIPNFFELPLSYAVSRSVFFIDVKFRENFDRGDYRFYNFQAKKLLYLYGKKMHNYSAAKHNFPGYFYDGYVIDRNEYLDAKAKAFEEVNKENKRPFIAMRKEVRKEIWLDLVNALPITTKRAAAKAMGIDVSTGKIYEKEEKEQLAKTEG